MLRSSKDIGIACNCNLSVTNLLAGSSPGAMLADDRHLARAAPGRQVRRLAIDGQTFLGQLGASGTQNTPLPEPRQAKLLAVSRRACDA
jgi:hypothetical protein